MIKIIQKSPPILVECMPTAHPSISSHGIFNLLNQSVLLCMASPIGQKRLLGFKDLGK